MRAGLGWADALSDVTKVRLSNAADLGEDGLLAYGTTFSGRRRRSPGRCAVGQGARTVYAQVQDAAGNWSDVVSDAITVDPPDTTYHPLSPVRLLDTRVPLPSGAAKLASGVPMRVRVAGRRRRARPTPSP